MRLLLGKQLILENHLEIFQEFVSKLTANKRVFLQTQMLKEEGCQSTLVVNCEDEEQRVLRCESVTKR